MSTSRISTVAPARAIRRPKRIRGLDGIRALAVLAVLIFHLRPASLPGGFIGVDIFFVVSGFLITSLLIRERASKGSIDFTRFWLRRARRLLPAVFLTVIVSVSGGLILGNDLLVGILRQTIGALTFSTNWVEIAAGSSYFAGTSPQLFAHFWSLAVEEQFYLLWPVLFVLVMMFTTTWVQRIALAGGGAAISAILMGVLVTPGVDVTRVYYGTDTHSFGLLLGVGLAFIWAGTRWLDSPAFSWFSPLLAIVSGAGIIILMLTLDENSAFTFRGGLLLASVLTAVLIASLLPENRVLLALAEAAPVQWIGERSYGIYLWHWPVFLMLTALFPATASDSWMSWVVRALALAGTLTIAAWSYRAVEQPVRNLGFREATLRCVNAVKNGGKAPRIVAACTALLIVTSAVGIVTAPTKSAAQAAIEQGEERLNSATPTKDDLSANMPGGTSAANADFTVPEGSEITGFGDSLLVTASGGLSRHFPDIQMDAKSNRQWQHAEDVVKSNLDAGTVRRAVIIDYGTNAGVPDPQTVRNVLDMLGPDRMIVVVNLYGTSTFIEAANNTLAEIVEDYPNAIIADWNSAASENPDMLQPDQTHPNIPGSDLFAQTVHSAFEELAKQHED
ncbi:MAG: acyltransferase family protein [Ancrocorticia sp.]|uniref:acyltransferase family protein n=1 Tax=Ancrocorticia sp. TaxID=2593684 RepID=UPI003F905385